MRKSSISQKIYCLTPGGRVEFWSTCKSGREHNFWQIVGVLDAKFEKHLHEPHFSRLAWKLRLPSTKFSNIILNDRCPKQSRRWILWRSSIQHHGCTDTYQFKLEMLKLLKILDNSKKCKNVENVEKVQKVEIDENVEHVILANDSSVHCIIEISICHFSP